MINKNIELISLIYKSKNYLDLITEELAKTYSKLSGWDVGVRLVANDAAKEIVELLEQGGGHYSLYNDPFPNDYYLNRVYRCWNYAAITSSFDNICFVNSDMVFSENWLKNLTNHHDGVNIPTSRLVESGKMPSGQHGISFDCGRSPKSIDKDKWSSFSKYVSSNQTQRGGLFMPVIFEKKRFIEAGCFPEGNIYDNGVGKLGRFIQSGDDFFFRKLENEFGMKHVTVFDSLVYHIQEGEKDSK